ncbi:lysophospholipase D GDPD3 isoform X2 [Struthio camelus]|uniref:lysophospholipase D GDPD3 isoform X2 n=1 Tax=Struthio camelus TaxID=8801 RepID=UPI0036040B97
MAEPALSAAALRERLARALGAEHVEVEDTTASRCATSFRVLVVAAAFRGRGLLQRHRLRRAHREHDGGFRQDLPPYKDPLEVTFSPGCFAHGSDRRVPRLEEVFERFPRVPVSVEIKDDDDELIRQVAELVQRHDRAAITVWASFEERILRKCRAADVFPGASGLPRAAAGQNGGESHHEEETAPTPQRQRDPGGAVGAERGAGLRRGLRPRGLGRHDRLPHAAAALPGRPPAPLSPDAWVPPGPGRLGPWLHPDTWVPHGARTPGSLVAGTQHPCSTQSPGETRNHVGTKGAGRPQNGPIPPRNGGVTLPAAARGPPMEPPNKSRLRRAAGDFSCPDAWAPAWGREQL